MFCGGCRTLSSAYRCVFEKNKESNDKKSDKTMKYWIRPASLTVAAKNNEISELYENFNQKNWKKFEGDLKEVFSAKDYEKLLPMIVYLGEHEFITTQIAEKLINKSSYRKGVGRGVGQDVGQEEYEIQ